MGRAHCCLIFNLVSTRIPKSFLSFYLGSPQHVLVPGVVSSEEQDITILLVELLRVSHHLISTCQVPGDISTILWHMRHSLFCVLCKLDELTCTL